MKINNRKVDHIVYCVEDLEWGIENIYQKLGAHPVYGGQHLGEGTHNALLNLGDQCYLEILAVDEKNESFEGARWMGIDLLKKPRITRWALKTSQTMALQDSEILQEYNKEMGLIKGGERILKDGKLLQWDLVMPLATPEVEIMPFMTDWSKSDVHPTDNLEKVCSLMQLRLKHPQPNDVEPYLERIVGDVTIEKGPENSIEIDLQCPNGIITLK